MSSTLGNFALASASYQGVNNAYRRACLLQVVLTFASGAPSIDATRSAPGFTIADGATGAYTGTAPKASRGVFWGQAFVPTGADSNMLTVTAYAPKDGTFTLQTHANAAPADMPDGSELWLFFWLEGG